MRISGGSLDACDGGEANVFNGDTGWGNDCERDHWAGEAATGSADAKNVDLLKSSSSPSSEREVLDCAGEWCL